MGMKIDEHLLYEMGYSKGFKDGIKGSIPKADYETRLRADMVAMLEQLDSEIQEQIAFMGDGEEANGMKRADNLVKDKINALKQSIWQDNYNGKKECEDGTNEKTSD